MNNRVRRMVGPIFFAVLCAISPAQAQQLQPQAYVPALQVFVDGLVAERQLAVRCVGEDAAAGLEADWAKTVGVVVATLWANNYPDDFVRSAQASLVQDVAPEKCDERSQDLFSQAWTRDGYLEAASGQLRSIGLTVIETPPAEGVWEKVAALFEAERPLQGRVLTCLDATQPVGMPAAVGQWNTMLISIGQTLIGAGFARPDVVAALEALDPNQLWQPVAKADREAMASQCLADESWQNRYFNFETTLLKSKIEDLLTPVQP